VTSTAYPGPGSLTGTYTGVTASATVITGVGANALFGDFNRSFTLQPVSVEGQSGFDANRRSRDDQSAIRALITTGRDRYRRRRTTRTGASSGTGTVTARKGANPAPELKRRSPLIFRLRACGRIDHPPGWLVCGSGAPARRFQIGAMAYLHLRFLFHRRESPHPVACPRAGGAWSVDFSWQPSLDNPW